MANPHSFAGRSSVWRRHPRRSLSLSGRNKAEMAERGPTGPAFWLETKSQAVTLLRGAGQTGIGRSAVIRVGVGGRRGWGLGSVGAAAWHLTADIGGIASTAEGCGSNGSGVCDVQPLAAAVLCLTLRGTWRVARSSAQAARAGRVAVGRGVCGRAATGRGRVACRWRLGAVAILRSGALAVRCA